MDSQIQGDLPGAELVTTRFPSCKIWNFVVCPDVVLEGISNVVLELCGIISRCFSGFQCNIRVQQHALLKRSHLRFMSLSRFSRFQSQNQNRRFSATIPWSFNEPSLTSSRRRAFMAWGCRACSLRLLGFRV